MAPEELDSIFDLIFCTIIPTKRSPSPDVEEVVESLRKLKSEIKSQREQTVAAADFTLEQAVRTFGLKYSESVNLVTGLNHWKIHAIPETQTFSPTSFLVPILFNYIENYDRSSEAACRVSLGLILNECVTVLKGNREGLPTEGSRPKRPGPYDDLKICCQVSFSHKRFPQKANTVKGRVDHSIGFVTKSRISSASRVFYSLLLVVEAKVKNNVDSALPQLIVYLACLREFRKRRGREDYTVYGVASDGLVFMFVMIDHDGVLKLSRRFDILRGELEVVLGCLKYILERAAEMRTPAHQKGGADESADNEFIHPPVDDDAAERGVIMPGPVNI